MIEGRLGWPVHLISDGLLEGIESALNLSGPASLYQALASGEAHIYPEVCQPAIATFEQPSDCVAAGLLGWRAENSSCHSSLSLKSACVHLLIWCEHCTVKRVRVRLTVQRRSMSTAGVALRRGERLRAACSTRRNGPRRLSCMRHTQRSRQRAIPLH